MFVSVSWFILALKSRSFVLMHADGLITCVEKQQGLIFKDLNGEPELCHTGHLFPPENTSLAISSSGTHPKCELLNHSAYFFMCAEAGGGSV